MNKKVKPYYIGAGVLFLVSGLVSKHYLLMICGMALMSLGFASGSKENDKENKRQDDK
jgi:hypothetical protein